MLSLRKQIQHWQLSIPINSTSVQIREGGGFLGDWKTGNIKVSNIKMIEYSGHLYRPRIGQLSNSDLKFKSFFSTQKCCQIKTTENNRSEKRLLNDSRLRRRNRVKEIKTDRRRQHIVYDNG